MKFLGTSTSGGSIYEFTKEETRYFAMAEKAVNGAVQWEVFQCSRASDAPMTPVFLALLGWVKCKLSVNELQQNVDAINKALGVHNEPTKSS